MALLATTTSCFSARILRFSEGIKERFFHNGLFERPTMLRMYASWRAGSAVRAK